MNTEERQLAEMLHRVTPEPPRGVSVEDVAFRLASEPGRKPRPGRGSLWHGVFRDGHGWTPVLAALSVFAIAGASAGIATVATSHHSHTPATAGGPPRGDGLGVEFGVPDRAVAVAAPGRGDPAGGRRDVGRQADQPPRVQPGLADR